VGFLSTVQERHWCEEEELKCGVAHARNKEVVKTHNQPHFSSFNSNKTSVPFLLEKILE
jgi:hypothetical protein